MTSTSLVPRAPHILEVRTRGFVVEARLNDIPVFLESTGRGRLFQVKCEPYLVTGENDLRLWLRLPGGTLVDDEAVDAESVKPSHFRVRVVRLDPEPTGEMVAAASAEAGGDPPVVPRDLVSWAWDQQHDPLVPGRVFEAGPWFFFAESPAGRWSWEGAPRFQPTSEDPAEIRVLLEKLWRAVSFLDVDAVVRLTREKTRELAVALGVNAAELELDQAGVSHFAVRLARLDGRAAGTGGDRDGAGGAGAPGGCANGRWRGPHPRQRRQALLHHSADGGEDRGALARRALTRQDSSRSSGGQRHARK